MKHPGSRYASRSSGALFALRALFTLLAAATAQADADNVRQERQLDEQGISTARAMGEALHRLHIPIGPVLSSPTYRALETVKLAGLARPVAVPELAEGEALILHPDGRGAAPIVARVEIDEWAGLATH